VKFEKIHNKGQAQLFKNSYLEHLTKTHPLVIWGMYLPLIIYFPYYAVHKYNVGRWSALFIFLAGMLFWTFFEYIMHRFLYHWVSENSSIQRFIYIVHGNHHEYPRDRERLFMPPVPSIISASILFIIMYEIGGKYVFSFYPGFVLGYLLYGSMHYAIHTWKPPFKWMKPLWRNHHMHHYKSDDKGFGVSTSFWDRVFGTFFDVSS
jgi:sterol desaturase/sphingolipid hydroxylase (fatty acid hydroxylase superfamily)